MYMRPPCWDNLVFVGNGARLRGLRENILQTLNARHLVSPSTATMFTSELPSNMATPTGTGAQTPTGSFTGAPHQLSSSGLLAPLITLSARRSQLLRLEDLRRLTTSTARPPRASRRLLCRTT
ncbi:hypothetical protein LB505_000995 [Fusarium chuoi]|nr:hypothetical protein LB505_000995 [Fusarium chuoi]